MRHSVLLGLIIESYVEGKNSKGNPQMEYMQQVIGKNIKLLQIKFRIL
jgi:hypothetical protein